MKGDVLTRRARHAPREARYMILAVLSGVACLCGIAYTPLSNIPPRLPAGLALLTNVIPIWVFGALWLTVGIGGILVVIFRRVGAAMFAAQFGMYITWTGAYGMAWILGDNRAWFASGVFLAFALVIAWATRVEPPLWRPHRWLTWKR